MLVVPAQCQPDKHVSSVVYAAERIRERGIEKRVHWDADLLRLNVLAGCIDYTMGDSMHPDGWTIVYQ